MDIRKAMQQLLADLQAHYSGVVGGGIRQSDGNQFIVIFTSNAASQRAVPKTFMGIKVVTEKKQLARAN